MQTAPDKYRAVVKPFGTLSLIIAVVACATNAEARPSYHHREVVEFDMSQIFFEENATDGDLGLHFRVDGEGWERFILFTPWCHRLVDVKVRGSSGVIGITELFTESAEPGFDEIPRDDFLALFPEGEYKFWGKTVEGDWLFATGELTHIVPQPPVITSPEEDGEVDTNEPLVVVWETVPDPAGSEIVGYEVQVVKDEDDERPQEIFAEVGPDATSFTVSVGFLEPGKEYKAEVLVVEASGNKILTEVPFETAEEE